MRILQETLYLLRDDPQAVTVAAVASRARCAPKTVYTYFRAEDLLEEAVRYGVEDLCRRLESIPDRLPVAGRITFGIQVVLPDDGAYPWSLRLIQLAAGRGMGHGGVLANAMAHALRRYGPVQSKLMAGAVIGILLEAASTNPVPPRLEVAQGIRLIAALASFQSRDHPEAKPRQ